MPSIDFTDFYITATDDPTYKPLALIEDETIQVIIQKYKTVIFTNQGEVLGDPNFGGNLIELLYETKVSGSTVQQEIIGQIATYIPELLNVNYSIDVVFVQDPINYQDIMYVYLKLTDYTIYAQIGRTIT